MSEMLSHGSAFPVELPRQDAVGGRLGFAAGVAVGLTLAAIAVQVWLAVQLAPLRGTWAAYVPESIANLSRLAVRAEWRWGVPVVSTALVVGLLVARVKRPHAYALVAALAIAAAIVTYVWAMAPFTALASHIR